MTTSNGSITYLRIRWHHIHNAGNRGIRAPWRLREKE